MCLNLFRKRFLEGRGISGEIPSKISDNDVDDDGSPRMDSNETWRTVWIDFF